MIRTIDVKIQDIHIDINSKGMLFQLYVEGDDATGEPCHTYLQFEGRAALSQITSEHSVYELLHDSLRLKYTDEMLVFMAGHPYKNQWVELDTCPVLRYAPQPGDPS